MNHTTKDIEWMQVALEQAREAMKAGEHPIGCVIVAGDSQIAAGQTSVVRKGTIVAHGELMALKSTGWTIFSAERPVSLYTTLEPCLMCIGAAMQCGVDEIIYGMPALPDGGTKYISTIANTEDKSPVIRSGVLQEEAVALMRQNIIENPNHPGLDYAKALLSALDTP